jgi:hypothetical protein
MKERMKYRPRPSTAAPRLLLRRAVVFGMVFQERSQQLPLLDAHKSLVQLGVLLEILRGLLRLIVIFRIIEHRGTHTVLPFLAHQDLIVHTTLATSPESIILRQLGIGHRFIPYFGIDLHDGQTRREPKDLGLRIRRTAKFEDLLLDHLGQPALAERRRDDQTGIRHILPMTPGLNVTKTRPDAIFGKSNDGLTLTHLVLNIIRAPLGDASTPCHGRGLHFVANDPGEILMGFVRYKYLKLLLLLHVHEWLDLPTQKSEKTNGRKGK